jgi:amino acid transporter
MKENPGKGYGFGWFKGVYTPSVLTIFGVVMYLRFGWVLGNVGLTRTILIVLAANLITLLTGFSLSALATNMKVAGGGAYFMISRSLGLEPGAAIGLPLFLAQALGVSFYIAGFSEAVTSVFPMLSPVVVGVATLLLLSVLAYTSADLALKSQFIIMTAIGLSLISFFAGSHLPSPDPSSLTQVPVRLGFWAVFAVFFPAVTGIKAGIAMSGDLKNPAKALPVGTLAAVISGLLVYLAIPVFLNSRISDTSLLLTRPLIMQDVARYGNLVLLGVWGASLSSAMGALLGAPRTLQALARDGVAPRFLGRGFGKGNDPRLATALVFCIALVGILAGDLNLIAPVLSMFFLTSYGFLNFSAGMETIIASPSWRPQFRVWWGLSLLGSLMCAMAMLMINAGATIIAALVCGSIYFLVKRRRVKARWGDMRYGLLMLLTRYSLYKLTEKEADERSWKPNLLVLSGPPTQRFYLVDLAEAISQDTCLVTLAMVLPEGSSDERVRAAETSLRDYLKRERIHSLVKTVVAGDPFEGGRNLINTYGFGPLVPNTILIGETEDKTRFVEYARFIIQAAKRQRNLVIVREGQAPSESVTDERIDVWWRGKGSNAGFMLALSHLIRKSPDWKNARLMINMVFQSDKEREGVEKHLDAFLQSSRLNAGYRLVRSTSGNPLHTIRESSGDARLVLIGLRAPEPDENAETYSGYYEGLLKGTEGLPTTALVLASEKVDFHGIFK